MISMKEELAHLLALQRTDLELESMTRRIAEIPSKIKEIESRIEDESSQREQLIDDLKSKEKQLHSLNVDLEETQEKVTRYETQLLTLSSNTEYKAMMHQIEREKENVNKLENSIIDLMEALEAEKIELVESGKAFEEDQEKLRSTIRGLEEERKRLEREILDKREERKTLEYRVDRDLLQKYEKLRNLRGGEVIVPVIDGACSGCHSKLPIQSLTNMKDSEHLVRCEFCGRLLVYTE
jgi:predicted  nucleic acid-binding Zn-ribbon protein